jgi:type IV pilus biogenesis/stability protein PilW
MMRVWLGAGITGIAFLLAACSSSAPRLEGPAPAPAAKPNLTEAARINTELGADYARKGLYKVAADRLRRAIRERPDYAKAHATLAFVYAQRGENEKARDEYQRALDLAPDDPNTQNNYAVFLCAHGEAKKAQRYFRKAISNADYSTPAAALTNAGVCALSQNQQDHAREFFRHALQVDANFPAALEQMAELSYQDKDYLRALGYARRYHQVAKPGPELLWVESQSQRALGHPKAAQALEVELIQKFPESDQAARLSHTSSK